MAPPTGTVTVQPDELYAHARAVAQMQQPMDRVTAALRTVTPDYFDLAYGTAGQNFALGLRPAREYAEDANAKISAAVDRTADQLVQAVGQYCRHETQSVRSLRAIGAELPGGAPNNLIAAGTTFDPGAYNVLGEPGFVTEGNGWTAGAGGFDSVAQVYKEITGEAKTSHSNLLNQIASAGLDGAGLRSDPLGTLTSWGVGWAMEHITPLKMMLDMVTGNEAMVAASAETWHRSGAEQIRLGRHYEQAVRAGTGGWTGAAGDAYRDRAAKAMVQALHGVGGLSHAMGELVAVTGEMVKAVRYAFREAISQAAAVLVTRLAARIGYMPPNGTLAKVTTIISICKNLLTYLITILNGLNRSVPKVVEEYRRLEALLPKLDGTP